MSDTQSDGGYVQVSGSPDFAAMRAADAQVARPSYAEIAAEGLRKQAEATEGDSGDEQPQANIGGSGADAGADTSPGATLVGTTPVSGSGGDTDSVLGGVAGAGDGGTTTIDSAPAEPSTTRTFGGARSSRG